MSTDDRAGDRPTTEAERLLAVEAEVAALRREIVELRSQLGDPSPARDAPRVDSRAAHSQPRDPPRPAPPPPRALLGDPASRARLAPATSGERALHIDLESIIGRYGTVAAGALVILIGIGTLVVWAVQRGLLTPEVRVALGALATACVAGAGLYFRHRGEARYGSVLLALSLAMTDVVVWGAGPRLHLVPTGLALVVVDVVSLGIATLAVVDESEFLLSIAAAGALAAPFVTSDRPGEAVALLSYGLVAQLGVLSAGRASGRLPHLMVLGLGALVYVFAAGSLPVGPRLLDPYLVPLFGGGLALCALLLTHRSARGAMSRAYLGIALLGVEIGWDAVPTRPLGLSLALAGTLAAITYAALWVDEPEQRLWSASAVLLPGLSLGVALATSHGITRVTLVLAAWAVMAGAMWRLERSRGHPVRGGIHLFVGISLASLAIANRLTLDSRWLGAALAGWGVLAALLARDERSAVPLVGVGLSLLGAASIALLELDTRIPFAYTPFATVQSASALAVAAALATAGALLRSGSGVARERLSRAIAALVPAVFVLWWGRLELVAAYSRDASTFLLTLYYAAVGVGGVLAGRRWALPALRFGGLAVALYAAAKAVAQATEIDALALRVGCYVVVGVFLLGAGWVYRESAVRAEYQGSR